MASNRDKENILRIWNGFFKFDPTSIFQLERKYFNNSHLEIMGQQVNGESYSLLCRKKRMENDALREDSDAWIMSAGYGQRESLIELLSNQIDHARAEGIKKIYYSNFSPGYFFPGLDRAKYPELYKLFVEIGFKPDSEALAMEAEIGEMKYARKQNDAVDIHNLRKEELEEILKMVSDNFPYDCYLRVEGVIGHGSLDQISVAKVGNQIVGYSMYASGEGPLEFSPGERFGCFEVLEGFRSLGIGSGLLTNTLINMKANGIRHAYFLWTSEKASHLYKRYGFNITRKFQIMSMTL